MKLQNANSELEDFIMSLSCSTVNDLFARLSNQFSVDIHERYSSEDPWGRLIRVGKFPLGMGTTLTEITTERVLSGSFENSWTDVAVSSGGAPGVGANPNPDLLSFGETLRSWNLQERSYTTPCLNLDDLKTSFQVEDQVQKTVSQLTQLTKTVLSNRRRAEYMRLVPKISCGVDAIGVTHANIDDTFPAPTSILVQGLLDVLRVVSIRNGAAKDALGMENGSPVLGLITSAETSRALLRNNPDLRQDLRYANPSELIAPLGVDRSYGGFYHLWDIEIPRFTYTPGAGAGLKWARVYPFVQSVVSGQSKWEPNPAYEVAAYELSYIFHPNVYEEAVQQVGPSIPGADFKDFPYYYSGQFFWLNILNEQTNPLGKVGRWLGMFRNGSKPIAPYLGAAIMHLRCVTDSISYTGCVSA